MVGSTDGANGYCRDGYELALQPLDILKMNHANPRMPQSGIFTWVFRALSALCLLATLAGAANAAELVMFRREGCPWCAQWDRELGRIYPKTEIGHRAPLRMLDISQAGNASLRLRAPIHYTPTFVLVEGGRELGRIEGYPGEAFFWGLLERLTAQLKGMSDAASGVHRTVATEPAS